MKQKHGLIPRILITLLGIGLIFMGSSEIMLGLAGKSVTGVITSIRREGGERDEVIPNRYTYNISYSFTLPDGRKIDGFTKRIGDGVYLKTDGASPTRVRYFPAFPYINALKRDTGLAASRLVLILAGGFLIFVVNFRFHMSK